MKDLHISERIKILRGEKGLTQQKLAEKAEVSFATITKIERGIVNPFLTTLTKLAKALEVELEMML